MINREDVRPAGPVAAVAVGTSAHAAAAGCLPELMPALLVLPLLLVAVRASNSYLRRRPVLVRAAAGQIVVHLALTIAASCSSHPAPGAQDHVQPALDVVMTAAHVGALIVMMTVAARVERNVLAILGSAATWARTLMTPHHQAHVSTTGADPVGHRRGGFVPTQVVHRRCGVTRGPPRRHRRSVPA